MIHIGSYTNTNTNHYLKPIKIKPSEFYPTGEFGVVCTQELCETCRFRYKCWTSRELVIIDEDLFWYLKTTLDNTQTDWYFKHKESVSVIESYLKGSWQNGQLQQS